VKNALMANVRENNKVFFSMVIAQAQTVEVEGDAVVFAYAPVHKSLRTQLEGRKGWLEQIATQVAGRPFKVLTKDGDPAIAAERAAAAVQQTQKQADLKAKAKETPSVQNILDVFGGEVESVEEKE
jgi:hypothetical protein